MTTLKKETIKKNGVFQTWCDLGDIASLHFYFSKYYNYSASSGSELIATALQLLRKELSETHKDRGFTRTSEALAYLQSVGIKKREDRGKRNLLEALHLELKIEDPEDQGEEQNEEFELPDLG